MHKIDAPGATVDNLFTEGNPSLSIPATEVSDDWLNDVQEEIVNVIEGQGITLVKGTQTQLQSALLSMIGAGGTQYKLDPLANNTSNQDITGLLFDNSTHKGAIIFYDIDRRTSTQNVVESGILIVSYDVADATWRIEKLISGLDNAGVTFTISSGGQVRANTNDLTGSSYAAEFRATSVVRYAL